MAMASWACRTAALDASSGWSPRLIELASVRTPACAPASDASSGFGEEDTPSQTTAIATGPAGVSVVASAIASSLRGCRRPRSVTPASSSRLSSTWSRPDGTLRPHDSQKPSALIGPGGVDSSSEHTGHCAVYPGGPALLTGGASSVPHDSQKLSAAPAAAPQVGAVTPLFASYIRPSSRAGSVMSASGAGLRSPC